MTDVRFYYWNRFMRDNEFEAHHKESSIIIRDTLIPSRIGFKSLVESRDFYIPSFTSYHSGYSYKLDIPENFNY